MESLKLENIIKVVGLPLTEDQGLALSYKSAKHVLLFFNEIQRAGVSYVPTVSETNFTTDGEILQLCTKTGIQANSTTPSAPVVIWTVNPTGPLASVSPRQHAINEPSIASTDPIISSTVNKVPVLQRFQKQFQQQPSCKPTAMLSSLGLPLPASVTSGSGQSLSIAPDRASIAPVEHRSQGVTPDISGNDVRPSAIGQTSQTSSVPGRRCISTRIGVFDQPNKLPDDVRGMTVRERSAMLENLMNRPIWYKTEAKALDLKPTPRQNDHSTGNVNGTDQHESKKVSIKQRAAMFQSEGPIPLPRLVVPVKGGKAWTEAELVGSLAKMIWPLVYSNPQDVNNNNSAPKQLLQLMAGSKVFRPTLQQILSECRKYVEGDADMFYTNILKDFITQYLKLATLLGYRKHNMPETADPYGANITSRPSSNILVRMVAAGDTATAQPISPKPDRFINDPISVIPTHKTLTTSSAEHDISKPKCVISEQLATISSHDQSSKNIDTTVHVETDEVDTTQRVDSEKGSSIASVAKSVYFEMDTTPYGSLDDNTQRLESQKVENIAGLDTEKLVNNPSVESVKIDNNIPGPASNTLVRMVGTDTSLATKASLPERQTKITYVSSDNPTPMTSIVENSFKSRSEEIRMDPILSVLSDRKEYIPRSDSETISGHVDNSSRGRSMSEFQDALGEPELIPEMGTPGIEPESINKVEEVKSDRQEDLFGNNEKSNTNITNSPSVEKKSGNISDVLRSLSNIQELRKTLANLEEEFLDALKKNSEAQMETAAFAVPSSRREGHHQEREDVDNLALRVKDSISRHDPVLLVTKDEGQSEIRESETIVEKIKSVTSGLDSTEMKPQKMLYSVSTQTDCRAEVQCTDEELHRMEDAEVNTTKLRSTLFEMEATRPLTVGNNDQSLRIAIEIVEGSSDSDNTEEDNQLALSSVDNLVKYQASTEIANKNDMENPDEEATTAVPENIGNVREIPEDSDICDMLEEEFSDLKPSQAAYEDGILNDKEQRDAIRAEIGAFVQGDLDMIRSGGSIGDLCHRGAPYCGELNLAHPEEERWKAASFHSLSPDSGDESISDVDEMMEELHSLSSASAGSVWSVVSGISGSCSLPSGSQQQQQQQQHLSTAAVIDKCFMFTKSVMNEAASKLNISALAETLGVRTNRSQDNEQQQKPYRVTSFVRSVVKQAASYLTIRNWAKNLDVENRVNQEPRETRTNSASTAIWCYQKLADYIKNSSITLRKSLTPYAHVIGVTTIGCLSLSHMMAPDALLDISMLYLTLITRPSMLNLLLFQVMKLVVGLYYFPQFQNYLQY